MSRGPIPTWYFAIVVVRMRDHVLLVHEKKHGQKWYLPAGRVEPGETIAEAAHRETMEEAGIPIILEGIIRVEHSPAPDGTARCRVLYLARAADETPPKSIADEHSLGAAWVRVRELGEYELRGQEVVRLCEYLDRGGKVAPIELIAAEDSPL